MVVALLVADERQETARRHLEGWLAAGEELHAPSVLPYEIANVLARRVFDGALEVEEVAAIWDDLALLGVVLHPFEPTRDGASVAAITNRLRRRHATDSTYVRLAQRLETSVWTLDGSLARNAREIGLPVALVGSG